MKHLNSLVYIFVLLLIGCSGRPEDPRLLDIARKVSESPQEMQARLDSIDVASLKESDKYFHALLRIKALDKAYVKHTSDSVILRVIDYYSKHKGSGHYPEALYYGGRVYSDMGDAPTALRYFQDALDALPEGKDNDLKSCIYSQMGSLLNSLWLYKEATASMEESIKIKMVDGDSLNLMRDMQMLGAIYMHAKDYDLADSCFRAAREIAVGISHRDTVVQDMYIAGAELYSGNVSGALNGIRDVLSNLPEKKRDMVYSYASQIYLEAGFPDTTYLFAVNLIKSRNNDYRMVGYNMLLSPELRKYSSSDSLLSYSLTYSGVLEEYLGMHDAQQATMQTSLYNYQTHERERNKAEESKRIYMSAAYGAIFFVLILCVIILYLRNRNIKTYLKYRKALDDISLLKKAIAEEIDAGKEKKAPIQAIHIETKTQPEEINSDDDLVVQITKEDMEKNVLRERLKEELLTLQKAGKAKKEVPESILSSYAYNGLIRYLKAEKRIPDSDELWNDLEEEVLNVSPKFKSGLYLLTGDRLKTDAYHMALLIKCGMTPTDLTVLVGRSKGAVSSRRGYICEMIFGQKLGTKVMDDIIRLL